MTAPVPGIGTPNSLTLTYGGVAYHDPYTGGSPTYYQIPLTAMNEMATFLTKETGSGNAGAVAAGHTFLNGDHSNDSYYNVIQAYRTSVFVNHNSPIDNLGNALNATGPGSSIGDAVGGAANNAISAAEAIPDLIGKLLDPHTWLRVAEFTVGALVLGIGVHALVTSSSLSNSAKTVTNTALKPAKLVKSAGNDFFNTPVTSGGNKYTRVTKGKKTGVIKKNVARGAAL